jgi:DNA-binding PadR family transcriptional regulator
MLALGIANLIRQEKQPPLARYCTLLVLSDAKQSLTSHEIAKRLKEPGPLSGSLDTCVRSGLVKKIETPGQSNRFTLTPLGEQEVKRLLNAASTHLA